MQHGSDRILKLMNRRYSAMQFAEFVANARRLVPDIHIGTDFIVGFTGETEADFSEALKLVDEIGFANIHCFAYSPRPGTVAAAMPDRVSNAIARERMERLRQIADVSSCNFALSQCGKVLPVIFERVINGKAVGWSDNYLEIAVEPGGIPLRQIVEIQVLKENICGINASTP